MSGVNKVFLVGYVGGTPDISISDNKIASLTFTFNTIELLQKNDNTLKHVEVHHVVMSGKVALSAAKILTPERLTYLEGRIATRNFLDRQGIKRYKTEIVAENFKVF